jgi:hypothetical protein
MPYVDAQASLRLYVKRVMPELRKLSSPAPFDSDGIVPPAFMAEWKMRAACSEIGRQNP